MRRRRCQCKNVIIVSFIVLYFRINRFYPNSEIGVFNYRVLFGDVVFEFDSQPRNFLTPVFIEVKDELLFLYSLLRFIDIFYNCYISLYVYFTFYGYLP